MWYRVMSYPKGLRLATRPRDGLEDDGGDGVPIVGPPPLHRHAPPLELPHKARHCGEQRRRRCDAEPGVPVDRPPGARAVVRSGRSAESFGRWGGSAGPPGLSGGMPLCRAAMASSAPQPNVTLYNAAPRDVSDY